MSKLLNTAIIGKFNKLSVICKPGSIHGCKSKFILTLLLKGALISNISSPESKARLLGLHNNKIVNALCPAKLSRVN